MITRAFLIHSDLFRDVVKYVLVTGNIENPDEFLQTLRAETETYEEEIVTIADYLIEKGMQQGIEQGVLEGLERGNHERTRLIAKNMLAKNTPSDFISEVTGLSLSEIAELTTKH